MRPIDVDALKKEWSMANKCEDCPQDARKCQYEQNFTRMDICEMLDEAPTVGGWISVKKKLPDVDGLYLVYGMTDAMRELLPNCVPIWLCDYYKEHGFYSFTEKMRFDYITHWMPLPEPPKED